MIDTDERHARVYIDGDPNAILVDLPAPSILHMLREAIELAATVDALDVVFAPLPLGNGSTGYVRPRAVTAIIPGWGYVTDDDDDEED